MFIPKIDYKGYSYRGWEDKGDDVVKMFHDVVTPDGNTIGGPWSPYTVPTREQFETFIDERMTLYG